MALALIAAPLQAGAAEVTVIISNALKTVMEDLAPRFEKATGHKLVITFGTTNPLKARIEKGEAFDMTLLGDDSIGELIQQGKLLASSRTVVARSGLGVAIRKDAAKPDISTVEGFKRLLLEAKTIGYLDGGLTGSYIESLVQRLGIADEVHKRHRAVRGAEAVAAGEVEVGLTQIAEVLHQTGTQFAGPLPPEIQNYTNFSAAISVNARQPGAARELIRYFASPEAARVMRSAGQEPQ